ncbi:MAG TPA: succinate dehydrogenase, hydrophobic membrane anchor protein [Aquirhabdus sp.]
MKSATGLTGSGSRDWVVQRLSAVVLGLYTIVVLGWILYQSLSGTLDYANWYGFMMTMPMKIFSLLSILALAGHAWIGMWTIFTDYINNSVGLRLVLQAATVISIVVFVLWGVQIFW